MKIAVITGASSGIGQEFAVQLDQNGSYDELWLIARREERLKIVAESLSTKCRILPIDLEKNGSMDLLENSLTEESPHVQMCINSAGFGLNGDFKDLDLKEQLSMIDLNCRAVVELTHIITPFMKKGASFINISSIAGASPLGAFAVYGASKSFLTSFSVGIASELKKHDIGMTVVTPGSVDTEFQKRSRGKSGRKKKLFSGKASAQDVVSQALKDASKNRLFSAFGATAKLAVLVGRLSSPYAVARLAYTRIYPKK